MEQSLEERVRDIIADQLGINPEQATMKAKFIDDLGADSLDAVEIIMAIEESFGIVIPEVESMKLTTVGSVVEYLKFRDGSAKPED